MQRHGLTDGSKSVHSWKGLDQKAGGYDDFVHEFMLRR